MNNLFDLSDRVALITGGSRGLGRQMALAFSEAGAHVVISSRKLEACESLAREIEQSTDSQALAYAANVGNWEELDGLVDAAYQHFGRVDILVNNAGMSPLYDELVDVSEALYDKVLDVNLKGPFRLMALVGSRMAAAGGGSIINISSIAATHPSPGVIPYAAAKSGLNSMTRGFANAFGPNVRVNCIQAGPFLTDISKAWDMQTFEKRAEQRMALKRAGRPEEIIGAALYFASDASSFTTGAVLPVDGGDRGSI
ncbi:MAG TPA: short-chain dehydrogenase [Gammaproteobacteria bacterium]|jgi:NAD(P)-dependent dehydrogenase (short-subunit alcohol dehydrogenase family)|nr:SDR family oxidoreductase [Gammaproteobacteria bacterium]MDP6731542.1 SDR family oxidoreductase [Gammaproteobacteria bacterium]HAJ76180.1 short-chain dehydrogenase [Gammaproteobacteria bacterium]